ncbi:MAG: sugar phosphate isomerase [Lentisphaeria bacterium]|nr:sugar phosphate isomerase [Lentisphaeria bacterium]
MKPEVLAAAVDFIENETEFHLGFLPTEQSNPLTRSMEADFKRSTFDGVKTLQKPDRDVLAMARRVLASEAFARMAADGLSTVRNGGRIVFSGCGATGRLSILLESMWREYFSASNRPEYADCAASIMTGGDYALVKSVEAFEDYQNFGRRQAADLGMGGKDMLVAITEGGETSSVIGTVKEAAERGAAVYLMFNNPAELLREKLVRCREVIDDPRVTVLDLSCGPMALAGSTRMQATTSEQLIGGALLESVAAKLEGRELPDFAVQFGQVLDKLESEEVRRMLADYIDFEASAYEKGGRLTYLANDYLLDVFTDTTERSPTFMLPPFRRNDDRVSPMPWAFVKNPLYPTRETWRNMLHREPRCLTWSAGDYIAMESPEKIVKNPPAIDAEALYRFEVGSEPAPERFESPASGAVVIEVAGSAGNPALESAATKYRVLRTLCISSGVPDSPLHLMNHMALKLALNTVSTGTMVRLGRVAGNWMSWVSISNKKLIDRAIRLVAELSGRSYEESCRALFDAADAMESAEWTGREKPSPVQYTLWRLKA